MAGIYVRSQEGALRQGEIITGLVQTRLALDTLGSQELAIDQITHPFSIVLSQDCDLLHDWGGRSVLLQDAGNEQRIKEVQQRLLPAVLFAEMTTAETLRGGVSGSDIWKRIRQNKDERYQFLEGVRGEEEALGKGLPELGIDFKRYFTIPTAEAYRRIQDGVAMRRCRLVSPYLEHLSSRFGFYQSRIALPEDHRSQ